MITAIAAILMFAALIFIHELGHMLVAKACGVQVNEFALGMGPAIFKKKGKETEYSLRVFPIGGYCAMEGEDEESQNPRAFNNKKAWQKSLILVAGPFMNFLMALILMIFITWQMGTPTTTVGNIVENSPSIAAGLEVGDTIKSIDGMSVASWDDIGTAVDAGEEPLTIVVERDGQEVTIETTLMDVEGRRIIGIGPTYEKNLGQAILDGPKATVSLTKQMYLILKELVTGQVPASELSGPVGIVYLVNESTKTGFWNFLYLVALISLNLGVMNLLPFPALDGGRLVFVIIRKLTGRVITDQIEGTINFIGMMCLIALMVFVTWNDIVRFFFPNS